MDKANMSQNANDAPQKRGRLTHVMTVDSFDRLLENVLSFYNKARDAYFATDPNSDAILTAAKKWEKASIALTSRAGALFKLSSDNQELRKKALDIITECARDAAKRELLIAAYTEQAIEEKPDDPDLAEQLDQINLHYMKSTDRAINTQTLYVQRFHKPGSYIDPELEAETRVSATAVEIMKAVPEGHIYIPARPYPPERIPEDELVPNTPEPYNRVKRIPVSEKVFDETLEEFVLPEGYISEDGLIDDESVVWDTEHHLMICKYRGGEPVVWPYWKAADPGDVPKPGSWLVEYYQRLYYQWLDEYRFSIF